MKKRMIILIAASCLAASFFCSSALAGSLQPVTEVRAKEPLALTCARLSSQINRDKEQLRSVLGYLNDYGCYTSPVPPSHQCSALMKKRAALEARIEANQQKARDIGCR